MGFFNIDIANVHERIPKALNELEQVYDFHGFDDTPLHRSIKLYSDFVARARRHEIDSHLSEALLHFVIALELIFGERQAIEKYVVERVALITFRENERSYKEQRRRIDRIYDARSKYVHAGVEIRDVAQLDELRILCEQVFRCLLRLQASLRTRSDGAENALVAWLRNIDYLAAGIEAGKMPSDAQFQEASIK